MKRNYLSASWHICTTRMWWLEVWQPFCNDEEMSLSVKVSMLGWQSREAEGTEVLSYVADPPINPRTTPLLDFSLYEIINLLLFKLPYVGLWLLETKTNQGRRCRKQYYRCQCLKLSYNFQIWRKNSAPAIMQFSDQWKNSGGKLLQIFLPKTFLASMLDSTNSCYPCVSVLI